MAITYNPYDMDAEQGFTIQGPGTTDYFGNAVAITGDVNGDGLDDLIVGARYSSIGGLESGAAYVIFGREADAETPLADIDINTLDPSEGFVIEGPGLASFAGYAVSAAGDVNGDGIADMVIGAPAADDWAGRAYVVFGRDVAGGADPFATLDLGALDPADGFEINGFDDVAYGGFAVSDAGDINGDGMGDILVGAALDGVGGAAYVIYGRDVAGGAAGFATLDVDTLDPADGFRIYSSAPDDRAGTGIASAGDVNGDGIDDFIVGSPRDDDGDPESGTAYVIYGRDVAGGATAFSDIDLNTFSTDDGFSIQGLAGSNTGSEVAAAGDLNGDGIGDLLIGAPTGSGRMGDVYVVFGRDVAGGADDFTTLDVSALDPADGFRITGRGGAGPQGGNFAGSVSAAGDVNGDGIDDIIIGASLDGPNDTGAAFVIFGRDVAGGDTPFTDIALDGFGDDEGWIFEGDLFEQLGGSVTGAGDLNGDGYADLVIGATPDSSSSSQVYVVYGLAPPEPVLGASGNDALAGGDGNDELHGRGGDDALSGGGGDDILRGGRGADTLRGGAGNDSLYGGRGKDDLSGNSGDDSLFGKNGNDTLGGGTGNDTLDGGAGNDKLRGGGGQDLLTGGGGDDRFIFGRVDESPTGAGDAITDFAAGDLIHLGRIDADATSAGSKQAFSWLGTADFTHAAGELRYAVSGDDLVVQGDVDGDGVADLEITLLGVTTLSAADFIL